MSSSWLPFAARAARLAALFLTVLTAVAARDLEAITFAVEPGQFYVPFDEAAGALRWRVKANTDGRCVQVNGVRVMAGSLRFLHDGTELINARALASAGAEVLPSANPASATVRHRWRSFTMIAGPKYVEINLARQQLRGWQGGRLVLQSRISSGRGGSTPGGNFRAGPFKARFHRSTRYNNAPMPWSVQINGHVFVHGFTSVPDYPASHGCIRLPLTGFNPARFFYEWVDNGTPVRVIR